MKRPADAQRTDEDEARAEGAGGDELAGQRKCSLRVDAEKVGRTAAFGGASSVDDVLPRPVVLHVGMELLGEFRLVAEVQFDEMDARVGEVAPGARWAHGGPHFKPSLKGLFNEGAADEATGTGD